MDISGMHVYFRQYAQQMGMQNVRAILPEQIDVLINTSISDTVNEIVRASIGLTNDRITTDNSKLAQINALRTLTSHQDFNLDTNDENKLDIKLDGYTVEPFLNMTRNVNGQNVKLFYNLLYFVDLAIKYSLGDSYTSWYPVRIIDNMFLADTLQDYILQPTLRSPIAVVYNTNNSALASITDKLEIYLGNNYKTANGKLKGAIKLDNPIIRVNFIAKPAEVAYLSDIDSSQNVNCNLPDYLHVDIVKHAVDLYRVAVQGSLYANQQQQQAQQREIGRNNVRPDNEGYQQ